MRTHNIIDKRQVDLAWISEYRLHLMGIATLGVLLCHAVGRGVAMPNVLAYIFNLGNYGVDIFLFLSGMSMYFSLKGRKVSLEQWYKKRFLKIMIPFLLIAIPVYAVKCIVSNQDFVAYILDITTLSYWKEHGSAWYVAMLLPLYLVTPLLGKVIDKSKYPVMASICGGGYS